MTAHSEAFASVRGFSALALFAVSTRGLHSSCLWAVGSFRRCPAQCRTAAQHIASRQSFFSHRLCLPSVKNQTRQETAAPSLAKLLPKAHSDHITPIFVQPITSAIPKTLRNVRFSSSTSFSRTPCSGPVAPDPCRLPAMRNLRNIRYDVCHDATGATVACWDAGQDEMIAAFGPSEDEPKVRLARIVGQSEL